MNEYTEGYNRGFQMGMIIDVTLWMVLGFLIAKFVIAKMYAKNNNEKMPTKVIWIIVGLVGTIKILSFITR